MAGATPDSLLAFHDAGYREMRERLGAGHRARRRVRRRRPDRAPRRLGPAGHRRRLRRRRPRSTPPASGNRRACASRRWTAAASAPRARSVDWVCSSHIIEHFVAPEQHVAELARVAADDGTALVITPNRPADFENPFHVACSKRRSWRRCCASSSTTSPCRASRAHPSSTPTSPNGAPAARSCCGSTRSSCASKMPRSWYVWGYEHVLPVVYRALGSSRTGIGSGLDESHFFLTDEITPTTPGLFAVARRPRR